MVIKNYTPHTLTFINETSVSYDTDSRHYILRNETVTANDIISSHPSEGIIRVSMTDTQIETINGIPVYRNTYGQSTELPPVVTDTIYIVSLLVAKANPSRTDFYVPNQLVYDNNNKVIGCLSLTKI